MTSKAGGTGDIWNQEYRVHGSQRRWVILASMMAQSSSWATMATNVPDFTRYLRSSRGVYWQGFFLPSISLMIGLFGIISCSAAKVVYGEYIWDPLVLASKWDGPSGRCGAFFVGFGWVVAQIGTNLSANVIPYANDMVNLFPKYISIRRGAIFATLVGGWLMVPWKIVHSASSLLTFMAGLAVFLAPISSIIATDYWLVKKRAVDVPALYRRHARYAYRHGVNWRAAVAFLVGVTPNVPGLANAVNPSIHINAGIEHLYNMNYIWGLSSAAVLYWSLSVLFPAEKTLLKESIYEDPIVHGVSRNLDRSSSMMSKGTMETTVILERPEFKGTQGV